MRGNVAATAWITLSYRQGRVVTLGFVTPSAGHWLGRETAEWVHREGSNRPTHHTTSSRSTMELSLAHLYFIIIIIIIILLNGCCLIHNYDKEHSCLHPKASFLSFVWHLIICRSYNSIRMCCLCGVFVYYLFVVFVYFLTSVEASIPILRWYVKIDILVILHSRLWQKLWNKSEH